MGLQIRVRHALGERVIELPDRTIESPLVVGRGKSAEIQLPSMTVASKHCVLFIHEGHWAVQDLGSGGDTFVSGEPVTSARFLQIGDVISIGADGDAPTIEVDPAAAAEGKYGYAGSDMGRLAVAAPAYGGYAPAGVGAFAGPPVGVPGFARQSPVARQPAHAEQLPAYQDPDAIDTADDAAAFAPASSAPVYSRKRKQTDHTPMILAMIAIAVVLAGGVFWIISAQNERNAKMLADAEALRKKNAEQPAAEPVGRPTKLFGDLSGGPETPPRASYGPAKTSKPSPAAPDPASNTSSTIHPGVVAAPPHNGDPTAADPDPKPPTPSPAEVKPPATTDPKKPAEGATDPAPKPAPASGNPDEGMDVRKPTAKPPAPKGVDPENLDPSAAQSWKAMQDLAETPGKENFAILRFEDFRRMNPGKYDAQLDAFEDKKLDRIWWERIDQLFKRRTKEGEDIPRLQNELFDETNLEEKKKKEKAIKDLKADVVQTGKVLADQMKYGESTGPDLSSEASLADLSTKRDKTVYEAWKRVTINQIKTNQGKLPWANEQ